MRIAIEAQRIFRTNKHGMDFVALEMIRELQKTDKTNEYFILTGKGPDKCLQETPNFHIIELNCPAYPIWEQVMLPLALLRIKPDLLHCTSNTAPLWCRIPLVITLHDIIFLEKRVSTNRSIYQNLGWYYRKFIVPRVIPSAQKIITVSDFERANILQKIKIEETKICTVYNGYGVHFKPLEEYKSIIRKYIPEEGYIFFLGNTDPKKNVPNTLKAYALYCKHTSCPRKLLVGDMKVKDLENILHELNINELKEHIVLTGYIPNKELPALYNGAFTFLYTSLRESFGIPLLEAMACGTPVITSNCSAIPEIASDASLLIDPNDPNAIAKALLLLESDQILCQTLIAKGKTRVHSFSWNHTALETQRVYQQINPSAE